MFSPFTKVMIAATPAPEKGPVLYRGTFWDSVTEIGDNTGRRRELFRPSGGKLQGEDVILARPARSGWF